MNLNQKYRVSIVRCESYNKGEVKKALEDSLKNINFEFKKGMKILIKPNILAPNKPEDAITTHPIVIEELCKVFKKFDAEIFIGDSSGVDTDLALEVSGMIGLSKYGKIINFEKIEKKFFRLESKKMDIPLPKIIFDVDLVINIAKMKTHSLTGVTLCVKNLYGCIPGKLKETLHRTFSRVNEFSKFLLYIHNKIKPQLNIIDGIVGIEGEGPSTSGKKINSKVIVAGKNAIAVDFAGSRFMGFNPNSIYTNKLSGVKLKEIEIIGNAKDSKLKFKKPKFMFIPFLNTFFPVSKIKFNKKNCKKCRLCQEKCPVHVICFKPFPECDNKKCIKCLCCMEICPYNAVYLEDHLIKRILKKLRKFVRGR